LYRCLRRHDRPGQRAGVRRAGHPLPECLRRGGGGDLFGAVRGVLAGGGHLAIAAAPSGFIDQTGGGVFGGRFSGRESYGIIEVTAGNSPLPRTTMTLTITLPPETEMKLRECAAQASQTVEGYVREIVEREVLRPDGGGAPRGGKMFDEIFA